jgi:dCMP deaminase
MNDKIYLEMAETMAKMSKCQSRKVAAIAVRNGKIIATGINGSLPGAMNCNERFPNGVNKSNRDEHHRWSNKYEHHAEFNLMIDFMKSAQTIEGCTIYINLQPCSGCSKLLSALPIKRIVYNKEYDFGDLQYTKAMFEEANIEFSFVE